MNDQAGGTARQGGEEAADGARQRREVSCGQDLKGDLTTEEFKGLRPVDLAGCNLSRVTKLPYPHEIPKYFMALAQVKEISADARKIFIGLLAACVYSWLVIGTTRDVDLILNTATSPLPIIGTPIPIAGFYVIGAALLAAVYCYFHFYLLRLWRTLVTLPVVFPDGIELDDKADPWLLTGLVRTYMPGLNPRPLGYVENLLSIFLAWWLVPITLVALWVRYLPAHYIAGLLWIGFLIAATTFFGRYTFCLARATLRPKRRPNPTVPPGGQRLVLVIRFARTLSRIWPGQVIVWFVLPLFIIISLSLSAVWQSPRNVRTQLIFYPFIWLPVREPTTAGLLNFVGIRTYADLREVEVAERPEGWDEDWNKIKRIDLRGSDLAFADLTRAFLPNADLRDANLTSAILERGDLRGAVLYDLDTGRVAQLLDVNLREAQLQGADRSHAQLQGADLRRAQLQGANLVEAWLHGANLGDAQLQGANLGDAQLQGANLVDAWLQGANLSHAQLHGANLGDAQLQGANLLGAQLQGADLRTAGLWRTVVEGKLTEWERADLRGSHVMPMAAPEIDDLIAEATSRIRIEEERRLLTERLTTALRSEERPAMPDFPAEWGSEPNVMFWRGDPRPEPFDWGPRKWVAEEYDEDLAELLADLACGRDVPEAQTRGLAQRALGVALGTAYWGPEPDRLWPRLFAARLTGPDCAPAAGLPEQVRRQLEQLAAQLKEEPVADAAAEAVSADPVE